MSFAVILFCLWGLLSILGLNGVITKKQKWFIPVYIIVGAAMIIAVFINALGG